MAIKTQVKTRAEATQPKMWEQCQPVLTRLQAILGNDLESLRIRGYNPDNPNSTKLRSECYVWFTGERLRNQPQRNEAQVFLTEQENVKLFQEFWKSAFAVVGKTLDHIIFVPFGNDNFRARLAFKRSSGHHTLEEIALYPEP